MRLGLERAARPELLAHAPHGGDAVTQQFGNLGGAVPVVIKLENPLTHRHWDGFHPPSSPHPPDKVKLHYLWKRSKGNSSKWIHDTFKEHWDFEWQEGYGAFSIGISGVEDTTKYIQGQAEHHRKTTFREEIEVFLKKHGMEYVERDLE